MAKRGGGAVGATIGAIIDTWEPSPVNPFGNLYDAMRNPDREDRPEPIIGDHLVPIGDTGFFMTPNDPADPRDCDRMPNSPWCGGTGIDPFGGLTGLSPEWTTTGCETCISTSPTLFFVSLPTVEVCYRVQSPGCDPPPPEPPEPPPPPPGGSVGPFSPAPPGGAPPGSSCLYQTWAAWEGNEYIVRGLSYGGLAGWYPVFLPYTDPDGVARVAEFAIRVGVRDLKKGMELFDALEDNPERFGGGLNPPIHSITRIIKIDPTCVDKSPSRNPPPPPPPPTDDPCKGNCMCCCKSSNNQDQTDLLRLIAKRLGTSDYPITTPNWLVSGIQPGTRKHESLTQLSVWLTQQVDGLVGEFPIRVNIEDADPTREGNQAKSVNLPNIAEALAEIYGMATKTAIDSDMHTSFLLRLAVETMAAKTAALLAQDYAMGNASYLGYKGNQVKRTVDYAFDPTKIDSLETILRETKQQIAGWENQDKDSVADYLQKLMFGAGLTKSVFFRRASDMARLLSELKTFLPTEQTGETEDDDWKAFIRQLNDPESQFNKQSTVKPEIDNLSQSGDGQ